MGQALEINEQKNTEVIFNIQTPENSLSEPKNNHLKTDSSFLESPSSVSFSVSVESNHSSNELQRDESATEGGVNVTNNVTKGSQWELGDTELPVLVSECEKTIRDPASHKASLASSSRAIVTRFSHSLSDIQKPKSGEVALTNRRFCQSNQNKLKLAVSYLSKVSVVVPDFEKAIADCALEVKSLNVSFLRGMTKFNPGGKLHDQTRTAKYADQTRQNLQSTNRQKLSLQSFLNRHKISYKGELTCIHCAKIYAEKHSFLYHMKKCHPKEVEEFDIFNCNACCRSYIGQASYQKHRLIHTLSLRCDKCNRRFTGVQNQLNHNCPVGDMGGENRRKCDKKQSSNPELKAGRSLVASKSEHVNEKLSVQRFIDHYKATHNGELRCTECNRIYGDKWAFLYHLKLSHPEQVEEYQVFTCKKCYKAFIGKDSFKKHMTIHTGPFRCDKCNRRFTGEESQLNHHCSLTSMDADTSSCTAAQPTEAKYYQRKKVSCQNCNRSFSRQISLRNHMKHCNRKTRIQKSRVLKNKKSSDSVASTRTSRPRLRNDRSMTGLKSRISKITNCNEEVSTSAVYMDVDCDVPVSKYVEIGCKTSAKLLSDEKLLLLKQGAKRVSAYQAAKSLSETASSTTASSTTASSTTEEVTGYKSSIDDQMFDVKHETIVTLKTDQTERNEECLKTKKEVTVLSRSSAAEQDNRNISQNESLTNVSIRTYPCWHCNEIYSDDNRLQDHLRLHLSTLNEKDSSYTFKCIFCKETFVDVTSFRQHYQEHKEPFKCPECGQQYLMKYYFEFHDCETGPNEAIQCQICHLTFYNSKQMKFHRVIHDQIRYKCQRCCQDFHSLNLYNDHMCHSDDGVKRRIKRLAEKEYFVDEPSFKCSYCEKTFKCAESLKRHTVYHKKKQYKCALCDKAFHFRDGLKKHILTHSYKGNYQCLLCGKQCRYRETARNHIRKCHNTDTEAYVSNILEESLQKTKCPNQQPVTPVTADDLFSGDMNEQSATEAPLAIQTYPCWQCNEVFANASLLEDHLPFHIAGDNKNEFNKIRCIACVEVFADIKLFRAHYRSHRPPFICRQCGLQFKVKCYLENHECHTSLNQPIQCQVCQKTFHSTSQSQCHRVLYDQIRYTCKRCDQIFHSAALYNNHMCLSDDGSRKRIKRIGEREYFVADKTFMCSICGKVLTRRGGLKKHMAYHEERKHKCTVCSKTFHLKEGLGRHMKVHSEKGEHQCTICKKHLKSRAAFLQHQRTIHSRDARRFQCAKCGKRFTQKGNMEQHILTHQPGNHFQCELCDSSFRALQRLQRHMKWHRYGERFQCHLCPKKTVLESELRQHIKIVHSNVTYKCSFCEVQCETRKGIHIHLRMKHQDKVL